MKRISIVILAALLLTGCLGPVKNQPPSKYVLDSLPHKVSKLARHRGTLLVLNPETRPAINTTLMAYTIKPYQISYFSQNQWAETPSQMLMPLIVQSLQNTNAFHAVVTPPFLGRYSYALNTEILQLQQNYIAQPSTLELTVRAQLTRLATNRVIATREFTIRQPILTRSPYGGVLAANQATARMLAELSRFTLKYT